MTALQALVLWDVDHTLVENAGVSKETYSGAFERLTGRAPGDAPRTEGRTDRLIMRDLFERHGYDVPPWHDVEAALVAAGEDRTSAMRDRGTALPGAARAIEALATIEGIVQALLTGNIKANARMKVTAVGLGAGIDFDAGAYGSDAEDRAELVAVAQSRASAAHGQPFGPTNTVLIGDTPRDVDAGRRGGAHVIAVASGSDSAGELEAAGAVCVVRDLLDTDGLVATIRRLTA
jgi:phosphoglycolate phosphatase